MCFEMTKVSKGAKIRNRYNQVPHLTQDTNGKVTNSQLDTTNKSHEVSSNILRFGKNVQIEYFRFRNFCEGFIFAKLRIYSVVY